MVRMTSIKAPLLPLPNVVFFPKTALPLFVDAPAYGRMIRDCALQGLPVTISMAHIFNLPRDQKGTVHQQLRPTTIGCLGIPYILDEFPDGGLKVLIKGIARTRLVSLAQNLPSPIYNVEILEDSHSEVGNLSGQLTHINNILESWVNKHVPNSVEREAFLKSLETAEHITNYVSMLLIRDCEVRQALLETDSLRDRIHLLGALLREGIPLQENRDVVGAIKKFETLEKLTGTAN